MSIELIGVLIAVLAVGAAWGGSILTSIRGLRQEVREDIEQLSDRVARVEHGQARLQGLIEGLREAIAGRAATG